MSNLRRATDADLTRGRWFRDEGFFEIYLVKAEKDSVVCAGECGRIRIPRRHLWVDTKSGDLVHWDREAEILRSHELSGREDE